MTKKTCIDRFECDNCGTVRERPTPQPYADWQDIRGYTVFWDNGVSHSEESDDNKKETGEWWFCSIECLREWAGKR